MPLIPASSFRSPWWLPDGHSQTLWPSFARRVVGQTECRERLELPDGDFLDLDWTRATGSGNASRRVLIVSHGLEGHSRRYYVRGLIQAFHRRGWDGVGWNFRGCSGEPNRLPRAYHSGELTDLSAVIRHVVVRGGYDTVALAGFSLGGNMTLKLLCEWGGQARAERVCGAVVFSVPCDLKAAAEVMTRRATRPYLAHFLQTMNRKAAATAARFPDRFLHQPDPAAWRRIRTFREFDDQFTAPLHGFRDAEDYWARASAKPLLHRIAVPTLILNARNDPFLAPACFPFAEAALSDTVWLEAPASGGHVGFYQGGRGGEYWHETRAAEFLSGVL